MTEATTKTPIQMEDGRTVEFTAKQRLDKETIINGDEVTVRLSFRNGAVRSYTIAPDMLIRFAAHGAVQKLGDVVAGVKDDEDAVIAVEDLIAQLDRGEWSAARAKGDSFSGASILIKALVELSGKSVEQIKAFLGTKTQAEKLALRRSANLAPIVQRLEAEKASKSKNSVDTEALLDELDEIA